jgi:capsular polysaccharide biosynthesis protein
MDGNIGLGFIVGLAGGIGLSFIIENLDTTLYATQQIGEVSVLPILGEILEVKRPLGPLFESNSPQKKLFAFTH